jgi:hypothetical protein
MPDDKRPKPMLDMTAERVSESAPRPALPDSKSGPAGGAASQKPSASGKPSGAAGPAPAKARRRGPGFFGYVFASLLGGAAALGGAYVASKQDIPGFSLIDPHTQKRLHELEERAASLESAQRTLKRPEPVSGNPLAGASEGGLNEMRARLDAIVTGARDRDRTVQSLAQRLQEVEARPGGGETKQAVQAEIAGQTAPLQQRLAAAERELEALTRAQNERIADARAASLTLALTNLKRAVSEGRPFPAELAAVETLSSAKLPVSQLAAYKNEGVAPLTQLQNEFDEASRKTIEAFYSNKTSTFMGDMLSRAKSAIQVRPSDNSGESVEAILGRMSAALKSGDLKTALLQGATLQSPPQEMMGWFSKAQARVAADEALRKTDQELLASLTRAPARRQ